MNRRRTSGEGRRVGLAVVTRVSVAAVLAVAGFVVVAPRSHVSAEVSGTGCSAHIAGVDAAGLNTADQASAVHVQRTDTIAVDLSGEPGQSGVHVDYKLIGGILIGKDGSGTTYSARISDYVDATGLYLVTAHSTPNSACSAAALVDVEGNPLSTAIGIAALAVTAVGALMVIGAALLAALKAGRPVRIGPSLLGLIGGILGSFGAVALMELYGTVFPTRRWTVEAVVAGLVVGLVLPTILSALSSMRLNKGSAPVAP